VSNVVADHLVLLDHLRSILVAVGEAEQVPEESHALFLERFDELLASLPIDPIESQYLGQDILTQVISRYPQIAHLIPRDLLWFFAGDCLHYLSDEEIDLYQALLHETDPGRQRTLMREYETYVLDTQAHTYMMPWWSRIVPHRAYVKGWKISPSHYVNQDLATVWLDE